MKRNILTLVAGALLLGMSSMSAMAAGKTIAVSWKTFQEERWKVDEAAIKAVVEAAGNKYISTDAQLSAAKQLTDIEGLISQKVDVILVVAYDSDAILPAFQAAADAGVKMISYDVLVEHPDALYVTFDNVGVGRLMAQTMLEKGKAEGDFAFIKGDKGDPNADFLLSGTLEVLKAAIDAGKIKKVGETYTDGWKPDNAQKNMEQILTAANNKVDAVVSQNDGMAGGVIAALSAQGLAGTVPVSGQDGDHAALNRVARGTQTVSVWKDARELGKTAGDIASALAGGKKMTEVAGTQKWSGGAKKVEMQATFLKPIAITKDNLSLVIEAGWIPKAKACEGAKPSVKGCE